MDIEKSGPCNSDTHPCPSGAKPRPSGNGHPLLPCAAHPHHHTNQVLLLQPTRSIKYIATDAHGHCRQLHLGCTTSPQASIPKIPKSRDSNTIHLALDCLFVRIYLQGTHRMTVADQPPSGPPPCSLHCHGAADPHHVLHRAPPPISTLLHRQKNPSYEPHLPRSLQRRHRRVASRQRNRPGPQQKQPPRPQRRLGCPLRPVARVLGFACTSCMFSQRIHRNL